MRLVHQRSTQVESQLQTRQLLLLPVLVMLRMMMHLQILQLLELLLPVLKQALPPSLLWQLRVVHFQQAWQQQG